MKKFLPALLTFLFILPFFSSTGARAEPDPLRYQVSDEDIRAPRREWYGLYADERKIGWGRTDLFRTVHDGEPSYTVGMEMHLKVISMSKKLDIVMEEVTAFSAEPPYPVLAAHYRLEQGELQQSVRLRRQGRGFEAKVYKGEHQSRMRVEEVDFTLADLITTEVWFRRQPEAGESLTVRRFDVSRLKKFFETYTVLDVNRAIIDGVRTEYREARLVTSDRGDVGIFRMDSQGRMLSGMVGGRFELRLEDEKAAKNAEYSADLFVKGLAEVDRRLGMPETIANLVLEVNGEGGERLADGPRQSVTRRDGRLILALGPKYSQSIPAGPADVERNLKATVQYPVRNMRIVSIAQEVVEGAVTRREKVEKLVDHVGSFLKDDVMPEPLSVFEVLRERRGDCTEHALLFTTLARAAGIPCREVTGLLYMGDDTQAFGGHRWNEVVIGGEWVPVDATLRETDINAAHIDVGSELNALHMMGSLSFKVLEVDRRDRPKPRVRRVAH